MIIKWVLIVTVSALMGGWWPTTNKQDNSPIMQPRIAIKLPKRREENIAKLMGLLETLEEEDIDVVDEPEKIINPLEHGKYKCDEAKQMKCPSGTECAYLLREERKDYHDYVRKEYLCASVDKQHESRSNLSYITNHPWLPTMAFVRVADQIKTFGVVQRGSLLSSALAQTICTNNGLTFVNGRWRENHAKNWNYCKMPISFEIKENEIVSIRKKYLWDTDDIVDIHCSTDRRFSETGIWNIWSNWSECERGQLSIRVRSCEGQSYERCSPRGNLNQVQASECPQDMVAQDIARKRCSRIQDTTENVNSVKQRHLEAFNYNEKSMAFWTLKPENQESKLIRETELKTQQATTTRLTVTQKFQNFTTQEPKTTKELSASTVTELKERTTENSPVDSEMQSTTGPERKTTESFTTMPLNMTTQAVVVDVTDKTTIKPVTEKPVLPRIVVIEKETVPILQCKLGWNITSGRCVQNVRKHLNYIEATASCNRLGASLIWGQGIVNISPKFKPSNFWMDYLGFDKWFWVAEKDRWRNKILEKRRWKNGKKIKIPEIKDQDSCIQCGRMDHCLASNLKEVALLPCAWELKTMCQYWPNKQWKTQPFNVKSFLEDRAKLGHNCEYNMRKKTYRCKDWQSVTLKDDIKKAKINKRMSFKLEDIQIPLTEVMLKIKKRILDPIELEIVTSSIFLTCVNKRIFIMQRKTGADKRSQTKALIAAVMIEKMCSMPLTVKRQQIWLETLDYLLKSCRHQTCKDFFEHYKVKLMEKSLIDGQREEQALRQFLPKIMSKAWRNSKHVLTLIKQAEEVPDLPDLQLRPEVVERIKKKIAEPAGDVRTMVIGILQEIEKN